MRLHRGLLGLGAALVVLALALGACQTTARPAGEAPTSGGRGGRAAGFTEYPIGDEVSLSR